jgi:hypothetical protein
VGCTGAVMFERSPFIVAIEARNSFKPDLFVVAILGYWWSRVE